MLIKSPQVRTSMECPSAFLSCAGSLVLSKGKSRSKVFSTELTFIGLLSAVGSLCSLFITFTEGLLTHKANMLSLLCGFSCA